MCRVIRLAEALDTSAGALLGEAVGETETADLAGLAAKLELLNKQFARQNESRRKRWRAFFIILLILTGGILIRELIEFIFTQSALYSHEPSIGIIGGADGPTAILVASAVNPMEQWLFALIAAILAIIGICKTGRR